MALSHGPSPIITNGLVLCLDAADRNSYPGSGTTWTDLSGNGNNGTLVNGVGFDSANGGSLVFDGVNDYCNLTNNSNFSLGSSYFTVECWVYPTSYASGAGFQEGRTVIGKWNTEGGEKGWRIDINTSNIVWYTDGTVIHTTPISLNVWTHIVATGNGTNTSFYKNGVLVSGPTSNNWTDTSTKQLIVGALLFGSYAYYYSGRISNTRIYKGKEFSSAEIQQNFNALRGRFNI